MEQFCKYMQLNKLWILIDKFTLESNMPQKPQAFYFWNCCIHNPYFLCLQDTVVYVCHDHEKSMVCPWISWIFPRIFHGTDLGFFTGPWIFHGKTIECFLLG